MTGMCVSGLRLRLHNHPSLSREPHLHSLSPSLSKHRHVGRGQSNLRCQSARERGQSDGRGQRRRVSLQVGLAQMLKGGVIMDVTNVEQARIAEEAGACAVMALERVPADIRKDGGVARMTDPLVIQEIKAAVTIPVMAKARIGHFVEAQILEALEVDYVDESEVAVLVILDGSADPLSLRFSRWRTRPITSTNTISESPLSADVAISAKRCVAFRRAPL